MYTPTLPQIFGLAAMLLLGSSSLPQPAAKVEGSKTLNQRDAGVNARAPEPHGFHGHKGGPTSGSGPFPSGFPASGIPSGTGSGSFPSAPAEIDSSASKRDLIARQESLADSKVRRDPAGDENAVKTSSSAPKETKSEAPHKSATSVAPSVVPAPTGTKSGGSHKSATSVAPSVVPAPTETGSKSPHKTATGVATSVPPTPTA